MNKAWVSAFALALVMLAFALSACHVPRDQGVHQLDDSDIAAERVCIDGVEYFAAEGHVGVIYTPHLMRSGKPWPCGDEHI